MDNKNYKRADLNINRHKLQALILGLDLLYDKLHKEYMNNKLPYDSSDVPILLDNMAEVYSLRSELISIEKANYD